MCGCAFAKVISLSRSDSLVALRYMDSIFSPSLPSPRDVFPFFVCVLIRLPRQGRSWRGAGLNGAPVLFLAAAAVGGSRGERRLRGERRVQTPGCLRDFCLRELLCNDPRVIIDTHTHTLRIRLARILTHKHTQDAACRCTLCYISYASHSYNTVSSNISTCKFVFLVL